MTTPTQPGWYDDPNDPNAQRYWDGENWTPHRQRKPASGPAQSQHQPPTQAQAPTRSAPPPPPPSNVPPPPPPAANVPPPAPTQPAAGRRISSRAIKGAAVLAGVALLLFIAAIVAGRVKFGTFLPGILVVAAIAIVAAIFTLRSHQSVARRAMVVTAIVLVVAAAIPASLKVVYPVYNHYFGQKSGQASRTGTAGSDSAAPSGGAPQASPGGARSGILVSSGGVGTATYGFIDPSSGKYSKVASFTVSNIGLASGQTAVSPDFTKVAATNQGKVGWVDTSGNFTDVTPRVDIGAFGGNPPSFTTVGFDGAGNFYFVENTSHGMETYKLAAGSTSNAQKINSEMLTNTSGELTYDGSMLVGCNGTVVNWLGPDYSVDASGSQIYKVKVSGKDSHGCPTLESLSTATTLLPKTNTVTVNNAVGNHDGTKVAFMYLGSSMNNSAPGLYTVSADGNGQPSKVNLTNLSGQELTQMTFLKWI